MREGEVEREKQVIPVCLPRLWGVINWLRCSACGQPFQCCDLSSCHYHPQPTLAGRPSTGPPVHICCGSLPEDLSPFPLPQVREMSRVEFLFYLCPWSIHRMGVVLETTLWPILLHLPPQPPSPSSLSFSPIETSSAQNCLRGGKGPRNPRKGTH